MAAFLQRSLFFLVYSALAHTVFSGILRPHDISKWPKPPCHLYQPLEPFYEADCPNVTAYVCAKNNHIYQNECFFCIDKWEFGADVQFEKYGKCN
ncbi:serine protease inhibitor Kazal-type 13 [Ochotona princeps]|uniref:serine protease inhibitor Kazal-type 13 n=1 Tax=Ochotona princeps TaxID=9978 RepID=UPI0027148327|nr:serine protease inhibitor Kazal-type 13 [Ochotona princeps]XP_058533611.1 serine protease inhibitor Kazal-type 13 [Ochotona princeps]